MLTYHPPNSFLDRDMLMRHFGHGVGHPQYKTRQEVGPEIDGNDTGETEGIDIEAEWGPDVEDLDNDDGFGPGSEDDLDSDGINSASDDFDSDDAGYATP